MKLLGVLFTAAVFGAGLAIAGMTDPAKIKGFLDLFGSWDPSLAFVMAGAIGAFLVTARLVKMPADKKPEPPFLVGLVLAVRDRRLVFGSVAFGIGWGLAGFCPGPALVNLTAGHLEAVVFVVTMLVGMVVAQKGFGADGSQ